MPEGTPHHTVQYNTATGTGGIAAGTTPEGFDNPVYSNEPPPTIVFPPGANRLIADDLITVAVGGCAVSGYEFAVGRSANWCSFDGQPCSTDSDCAGSSQTCIPRPDQGFTADFALYDGCPGLGGQVIPTTDGTLAFADNAVSTVLVDFGGNNIQSASTIWLGLKFNKPGAGWVVGTPASIGFTENIYHHPNFPCAARFTGTGLYAGYHAKVFCSATPPFEREFLAYFNPELDAPLFAPGGGQWIADDVTLIVDDCIMTSYEIGSVGGAPYTLDAEIWTGCSTTSTVAGTEGTFQGAGGGLPELARFSFPQGIPLTNGANYWVAWKYSNNTAAIIAEEPTLGESGDIFGLPGVGCGFFFGGDPQASFNITIRCLGDAPTGACCDLTAVPAGGVPLCREVTQIACTGELSRYNQGAKCPLTCSIDGGTCVVDADCGMACSGAGTLCVDATECPAGETCDVQTCLDLGVAFTPACGTSACCTPPGSAFGEGCTPLERDECLALQDVDANPGIWQRGLFCNQGDQNCVRWVCRFADGNCDQAQPFGSVGCNNPNCCDNICNQDPFCCDFQWDGECVARVNGPNGCQLPVTNDHCFDAGPPEIGAFFVDVSTNRCGNNDNPCTTDADCGPGTCNLPRVLLNTDGAEATPDEVFCCDAAGSFGTVWARFVAPATSMVITTFQSEGPATDAIIQVFSVGDNTSRATACGSLTPIGCDNDSGPAEQASLSLRNLTVGDTYYLMLAADGGGASGIYDVKFDGPATGPIPPPNNSCSTATGITAGQNLPYDLTNSTGDCPIELAPCLVVPGQPNPPNLTRMDNDVWFEFTAIGSGVVTVDTCELGGPDTTMTIYRGNTASCPPDPADRIGCSNDAGGTCGLNGLGSSATFNVISFEQYLIRIGGLDGSEPTGMVNVSNIQADCQPNFVPDADEIACGAGNFCGGTCSVGGASCGLDSDCASGVCEGAFAGSADCQGNTLPDECDIALGISQDCNANGIPDGCDISGGASQDCNANGIPDECDGGCTSITIASSSPPNGEIDARQPTSLDGTVTFGWDSVVLTFDADASAVTTGDLAVASTSGVAPTISAINIAGTDVTVTLSGPIPAGAWTSITYSPDGSSVCLGFLPGDVNADGTSTPSDILAVIDSLNGIIPRPVFATDADRSGVAGPEDILRVIDLLNGASALDIWLDATLGASPCP